MFKDNLKNLRLENNMSQIKLAKQLNVSYKTISHWESGYTEPSIEQINKLKDFFKCEYEDLLS